MNTEHQQILKTTQLMSTDWIISTSNNKDVFLFRKNKVEQKMYVSKHVQEILDLHFLINIEN